eukprot:5454148-Pleurochrysis_carterae.AAC.3
MIQEVRIQYTVDRLDSEASIAGRMQTTTMQAKRVRDADAVSMEAESEGVESMEKVQKVAAANDDQVVNLPVEAHAIRERKEPSATDGSVKIDAKPADDGCEGDIGAANGTPTPVVDRDDSGGSIQQSGTVSDERAERERAEGDKLDTGGMRTSFERTEEILTPVMREMQHEQHEREGLLRWPVVRNDGKPGSLMALIDLKNVFGKQLPKMPKEYIVRLVLDRRARHSLVPPQLYPLAQSYCFLQFILVSGPIRAPFT